MSDDVSIHDSLPDRDLPHCDTEGCQDLATWNIDSVYSCDTHAPITDNVLDGNKFHRESGDNGAET